MNTYIPSKDELQKAISEAVEAAVTSKLPDIISKVTRKPYYTIDEACEILSVTRRHFTVPPRHQPDIIRPTRKKSLFQG